MSDSEYVEYNVSQFGSQWLGFVHQIGVWARSTGHVVIMDGIEGLKVLVNKGETPDDVRKSIDEVVMDRKMRLALEQEKKLMKQKQKGGKRGGRKVGRKVRGNAKRGAKA